MAKRFIHFLKIFGITLGIFVGAIGIYLGIVFLITGFKPEVIKLDALKFSQKEYFFSDKDENGEPVENVTIMVVSEPEDTTQKQVELTFLKGAGHDVVKLPIAEGAEKCIVNVNEPIALTLIRDEVTGDVMGGEVVLRAIGVENTFVSAECFIYIDTPVNSFDVSITRGEEKAEIITQPKELASKIFPGYELDFAIKESSVLPENSLQPFNEIYKRQLSENVSEENLIRNDSKKIYWESSDTTRAKVDENGKVTILNTAAKGEVTITGRIYKTYELQDSHKTLFDFEYDVNIDPDNVEDEYAKYIERITATKSITLTISDMDVDNISVEKDKITSVSGFHYTVGVNQSKKFYLDGDKANSLGLKINPSDGVTEQFTSEDLRYKLNCIFVVPSYAQGGISNIQSGNDCLTVSSIGGNLEEGFYFTVRASYPQNFIEKATCLIVGLGVWDDETKSLQRNADGSYVLAKNIDGEEINYLTIHIEITTREAELLAIASSEDKYTDIAKIPDRQEILVDKDSSVKLDAYIRYTDDEGKKITVTGKAGKLSDVLTYSMVAFFVPEGTEAVDYNDKYGINLGGMWYPIGNSPILDCYTAEILEANSVLSNFKTTGEFTVIAVLLRTDADGRVLLVDENNARPVDEDGNIIDPSNYDKYVDTMKLYYDYTIKSGTQDVGGAGQVNNFTIKVDKKFDVEKLEVKQKYGDMEYEVLSAENNNLNQIYINDGSSNDYVYLLFHYQDESASDEGKGILQSAFQMGNFELISDDAFQKIESGLTNDGETISEDGKGTDILYKMGKMGNTSKPITVKCVLNGEIVFSYKVSITNKRIEKLYLTTNAVTEKIEGSQVEKITVTVDPSDQNTNANWSVQSYNQETGTTNTVPLEISSRISYKGAESEEFSELLDDKYEIPVFYTISKSLDGEYGSMIKINGNLVAELSNNGRYFLTSKAQPDNDYYGTISFYKESVIYLKSTIAPYNEDIISERIYEIHIVVDAENWVFNKTNSTDKSYLQLDMPLINNRDLAGEMKYTMVALDEIGGGISGTYAQLYDTDPSSSTNDVSTLLVDLSKFVSISYKGDRLPLSNKTERTKFLKFEILSYNVLSPSSGTYDTIKDSTFNKAEIYYNEDTESYFLRIKAVNYNTRININVSTYFGVKDTYTILVTAPITSQIISGYDEINQEYVAKGIIMDLLDKINILTNSYIHNNEWVGSADLSNESFATLIKSMLVNTGVSNVTNNTDQKEYISVTENSTIISVVDTSDEMISFRLNTVFDLDQSTPNGTQVSQETEWVVYYYVRLIQTSEIETNYTKNVYTFNNITYKNFFVGQTYYFDQLDYIVWKQLQLNGTDSVEIDENKNPVYANKTDELNLEFDSSAFTISDDGHEIFNKGVKIASLKRNVKNFYNILVIEPNIFDGIQNPTALLLSLKIINTESPRNYNIRINPLTISTTVSGDIETYVGTTYDMNDCITIKSSTNNDNLQGLEIKYEIPDIVESIDNKPYITIDEKGVITITPQTTEYEEDGKKVVVVLNPSRNFEFEVIVKLGTLTKKVTFICGRITSSYDSPQSYTDKDIIGNTTNDVKYVSMLEGSIVAVRDIVKLRSSIVDNPSDSTKEIYFSNYMIKEFDYALYDNENNQQISNQNIGWEKVGDTYNIYYREQIIVSLSAIDNGKIEATTYLPDNYSFYFYVTCYYNSSYTYKLPIRINSIVFTSTLDESTGANIITDENGKSTVYLVSCVDGSNSIGKLSGDYITAKSNNFINASNDNVEPFDKKGNITLDLTFSVNEMDNVIIQSRNNINYVYGFDYNGEQREICQIDSHGGIQVTERLADSYEFNLEVLYTFQNSTSVHSICSYKIVITPEYSLVQRDESQSYTIENPYEVSLAQNTTLNLLSKTDGVLILKHVKYVGNKIQMDSYGIQFEYVENVSPIIITTDFDYGLVDQNDPNRAIFASECRLENNILYLPCSISSDILMRVTATVTISNSQTSVYNYYFLIKTGVELELKVDRTKSKVINGNRYYNVTTTETESNDSNSLVVSIEDIFNLSGDLANVSQYKLNIESAYLTDYMGNDFVSDGIKLSGNEVSILDGSSVVAKLSYLSTNGKKKLVTTYALQKEVFLVMKVTIYYRETAQIEYYLRLRFMPRVIVASTAQNTVIPVIAGKSFSFENNVTLTELNPTTFAYDKMSDELLQKFKNNIKFNVDNGSVDYAFTDKLNTDATLTSVEDKQVDIILTNNLARITLFTYRLRIYPYYKFDLEGENSNGEIELLEGQTEILPNKYVVVYSVKFNGDTFEQLNGEPVYIKDEAQTDALSIEIPSSYSNYAKSIENVKVYIKKYTSTIINAKAVLTVGSGYMKFTVPIKTIDIVVTKEKYDNHTVTSASPIILPAGTNEQGLMLSKLTDDSDLYFYNLYYKNANDENQVLYYDTASTYHRIVITGVDSTSKTYRQKDGTDNVVENASDTSIIISFADNKLTVSGRIKEEVNVTVIVYVGDYPDESSTMYFRFYPIEMEEIITDSYVNDSGENFQILACENGASILINQYLKLNSSFTYKGITTKPAYDFTNRVKFTFPISGKDAIVGKFRYTISGTQDRITLTPYDNDKQKVYIDLVKDGTGTRIVIDQKMWDTSIQEFELVVKAQIGLIEQYLKFYVSSVAFRYNYAYKASNGNDYYYHSMYVDYTYNESAPYDFSNKIDLSSLIMGNKSGVTLELSKSNMNQKNLEIAKMNNGPLNDDYMGTVLNVFNYVKDDEGLNYAYLSYSGGKYTLSFNVKTKTVMIDKVAYSVPIISETLDIYLTLRKDTIERTIHIEVLPYVQMQASLNDTYERVNDNNTPDDASDDTVEIYDYYLSGNNYKLDYFYNYKVKSCYSDDSVVKDIRNTVLTRVSLLTGGGVTYSVISYEKYKLEENTLSPEEIGTDITDIDGCYVETFVQKTDGLPIDQTEITFEDATLTIGFDLDYVVYIVVVGRAGNGYESKFYMKIIPNILFKSIEETGNYINKTTSGEKFELVRVEDEDDEFLAKSEQTTAKVTAVDTNNKIIRVSFTRLVETETGTVEKTYTASLDIFDTNIEVNNLITIYYNVNDPSEIKMGGFIETLATVIYVQGDEVRVQYAIDSNGEEVYESTFTERDHGLIVGKNVLIKYSRDLPEVIKYTGYLKSTSTFSESSAVETILTGKEYYLKDYLCAYTPSIQNNKIQEYYNKATNATYTVYADKTLDYKFMYAWYYSSITDASGKQIPTMAEVTNDGKILIDNEVVVTLENDVLVASSDLAFDIYLNIEGSYKYTATKTFKKTFYLRIVPAMKFFILDSSNSQEHEVGKGETVLPIECVSGAYIKNLDNGKRTLNLGEYIKGRKIVSDNGVISINGNIVSYSNQLVLNYELKQAKVYTLLQSSAEVAEGENACNDLLRKNALSFENGLFTLEKTYNTTCDITLRVTAVIDDTEFSFIVLVQLYRESLLDINFKDKYVQDETIVYETIVSGASGKTNIGNTINFNNGYMTPYVWSSTESAYVKSTLSGKVTITSHSICKANSPAGLDKTSIQNNIVVFNDSNGIITAYDEILGDYYFTIQIKLNYNGKDNSYVFYFRVLGRYTFATSELEKVYVDQEKIKYNQLIEPERTEADKDNPIYAKTNIMTTKSTASDGLILIGTRTVASDNTISISYTKTFLTGLVLDSAKVETASGVWNSSNSDENQFTFNYTAPTTSNKGTVSLGFNDNYYTIKGETKKSIIITLNFTFSYSSNVFSDIYSIQYKIMLVPFIEKDNYK